MTLHTRTGSTPPPRLPIQRIVHTDTQGALRADQLVEQLTELPAQPTAALRVLWLLDDPEASLADLSRLIESDPALSARVIHLANSPFYGLTQQVGSALRAVTVLGSATVRALAAASAGGLLEAGGKCVPEGFWAHAGATAAAASVVAKRTGLPSSEAFSAGLLHDLGSALLFRHVPEQFEAVQQFATLDPDALLDFERRVFGLTHPEAAAAVLETWRFPPEFIVAVGRHHEPIEAIESPLGRCVVAGDALAHRVDPHSGAEPGRSMEEVVAAAGIKPGDMAELLTTVEAESGALAAFLAWD